MEGENTTDHAPTSRVPSPSGDGPLRCYFHIWQRFTSDEHNTSDSVAEGEGQDMPRPPPAFDTPILRRLLQHIGASLDLDISSRDSSGRSYELSIVLDSGDPSVIHPITPVAPRRCYDTWLPGHAYCERTIARRAWSLR